MPSDGQQLVRSLFDYVIAYTRIKTPCARNIVEQPWFQYLGDIPRHETVVFAPPVSSDSASGCQLLKVGRAKLVAPPRLPDLLADWMDADWRTQQDPAPVPQRDSNIDGETRVERFDESSERIAAFDEWIPRFRTWNADDRSARAALKLFEKLYEVHGIIQRESELWELAVGDGFLFHASNKVDHPLLTHALQLDFDPKIPEFTVTTALKSPEIYVALLAQLGLDGRHLNAVQDELEGGQYSPLGADETTAFLKGLIQRFGNGVFCESREVAPPDVPTLYRKPVLFVRRRDTGFGRALSAIAQAIEAGVRAPEAILKIVGMSAQTNTGNGDGFHGSGESALSADNGHLSGEIAERQKGDDRYVLFSKESNAEQFEIAHRLRSQKTVLVQGPPGTGKTHTIANLIGALLAQGKTVLVTSQASKPLRVLREKIVPELQPLCVSVVAGDEAGRRQLESSVNGITERLGSDSADRLETEAVRLTAERQQLLNHIDSLRYEIFRTAEAEYRPIRVGDVEISPSAAARFVRKGHGTLNWIPGPVKPLTAFPLDAIELSRLYATSGEISDQDIAELQCDLPAVPNLPLPEDFQALVSESVDLAEIDNHPLLRFWQSGNEDGLATALKSLASRTAAADSIFSGNAGPWTEICILAGIRGEASQRVWRMLTGFAQEVRDFSVGLETDLVLKRPELAPDPIVEQQQVLREIIESLSSGGGIGRFTLLLKRDWKRMIEGWRIRGSSPVALEDFLALKAQCDLEERRDDLRERWKAISPVMASNGLPQTHPEFVACQAVPGIHRALEWHSCEWEPLIDDLKRCGLDWDLLVRNQKTALSSDGELLTVKNLAAQIPDLIHVRLQQLRRDELKRAADHLRDLSSHSSAVVVADLRRAAGNLDSDLYASAYRRLMELATLRPVCERRLELLDRLREVAPAWAENIVQRSGIHGETLIQGDIESAWLWIQYSQELDSRNAASAHALQTELESCQKRLLTQPPP